MKVLREKYEDIKAEWLTLKQTNTEYKRTLGEKVKEGFRFQKDYDLYKQKNELVIAELTKDNDNRHVIISQLQSERDILKEHICSLEGALAIKEREQKKARDIHEEEREKNLRDLRGALEEL